ncbi:MAG: cysteine desulfurase [Acidobacteria bacterium]|nr:cysteine desulfurase [Acidobacteriota bacterium]
MRTYLDYNATAPLDSAVAERMGRALADEFGNPSSIHHFGQRAKIALDEARSAVAALVGGDPAEVVFTSGGTESDNLALRGAALAARMNGRRRLIASAIEHEAVLATLTALERDGFAITLLAVDDAGVVAPARLREVIGAEAALVSVMHANNEVGTIQPIAELAGIARDHGALFHTDAVQSAGKIPVDVRALGVDLASISAHKFGGPKGAGALWVRRGTRLVSHLTGGGQERGRRAGTENVPALIGFGVAAGLARARLDADGERIAALRDRLEGSILASVPGTVVNGARAPRIPNTTNISFDRVEAESLLIALDLEGIAVSTGSACSSGTLEPSHVLTAMGLPGRRVQSAIRFSLGSETTGADVDRVLAVLPPLVDRLRRTR